MISPFTKSLIVVYGDSLSGRHLRFPEASSTAPCDPYRDAHFDVVSVAPDLWVGGKFRWVCGSQGREALAPFHSSLLGCHLRGNGCWS